MLIKGGVLVNEGRSFRADLVIENDKIAEILPSPQIPRGIYTQVIDATGCFVLPGVIDEHVHFREPGLTDKATIASESRAAAYGGVTSYLEMPNTKPQTTTLEALEDKFDRARRDSCVNYSFFFGATNDNIEQFAALDKHRIPGIKLFMGASTGNMLVDNRTALEQIFAKCTDLQLPLMTHCEDSEIINRNMEQAQMQYGDDPAVIHHPEIRSTEACLRSSELAMQLASTYHTHLHIAHVSTAAELALAAQYADAPITLEAVTAHLVFTDAHYQSKGALIKCNPAVKTEADRDALRRALADGTITTVATDHAPHQLAQKQGGCCKAASGMPMVQFALPTMLELVDEGVITIERMVQLMSHAPAALFDIHHRGFIREGYQADLVVVRPHSPWTVTKECIQSQCGWSPMLQHTYQWSVEQTICNGHLLLDHGQFDQTYRGEALAFRQ